MPVKTTTWDVAEHLDSPEAIAAYLDAAMEDGDPSLIAAALGDVARARGMTQMAKETGIARESLYRALSPDGHPEFSTVLKVMKAFGLRLSPVPAGTATRRRRTARRLREPA
jgi:probable addiction module antidote protein